MSGEATAHALQLLVDAEARKDSLEIGTPSKGGLKVYLDAGDPVAAAQRLQVQLDLLQIAKESIVAMDEGRRKIYDQELAKLYEKAKEEASG